MQDTTLEVVRKSLLTEESLKGVNRREAVPPFILALDVGTSSVRASFYDALARQVSGTRVRIVRTFCTTADGGAEVDPDESVAEVVRVVSAALAGAPEAAAQTEAVAVACFWHSLLGVGRDGRPLTPVYGWADTRAALEVEELRRRADEREAHARTGCRFHPSYWPAKLLWLGRERAAVASRVARWMSFGEFLAWRLCGETPESVSMASGTGLLDLRGCVWDEELLQLVGARPDQMPPLAEAGTTFKLAGQYAGAWPQLYGIPWFPAVGDGAANNIGAGCVSRESLGLMVGTSCAMRVLYEGEAPDSLPPGLWCYRADRRRVVTGGALSDGGGLYAWMSNALALGGDAGTTEEALAAMEPDAHGLTVLPFWAGERSTGWNPRARGAILGLTMHTQPVDLLRAALEGVAYRIASIAEALAPFAPGAEVRASGGAISASRVWAQIIADVLGRPVKVSGAREDSSRGVVGLALEALGRIKSLEEMTAPSSYVCEPDAARHERYRAALERHRAVYDLLSDPALSQMIDGAGGGRGGARLALSETDETGND